MSSKKRTKGTDPNWPEPVGEETVVSELVTDRQGRCPRSVN